MAKAYVATLEGNYSDIVLGRVVAFGDTGWNFKEVNMVFADTLFAGLLVKKDGTPVASAAEAGDTYGVLVDRKVLPGVTVWTDMTPVAGETLPMVLAVRGLTLNQLKLKFADEAAINAVAIEALEAQGNLVTDKIVGTGFIGEVF